jgi:3-phosphoshikimate 1-carboxyvinyltransferase
MVTEEVSPVKSLRGSPVIPGDKSISHRALILGALSQGQTEIKNILESGDVHSTASCLRQMGVEILKVGDKTIVRGYGGYKFKEPREILDCGNSGTTMRLLMGVLAGQNLTATLSGDESLVRRPMKRVADPLTMMGANFRLTENNFAPLTVTGKKLKGINYELKIASAQIKTAIMLAALNAEGTTTITGEIHSRDHTERMLNFFGVKLTSDHEKVVVVGGQSMRAQNVHVPGDPSTAAFWLGAASLVDSEIEMKNVSLNSSRTGFAEALKKMGAMIKTEITVRDPEPTGTLSVSRGDLKGIHVKPEDIPALVDEIPLLAVLATQAHGETLVEGAQELRVKESDRLEAVAHNLRLMGAKIDLRQDGFLIKGPQKLKGAVIDTFHDHRIAMAFSIAGLVAEGITKIEDSECVGISYPDFFKTLKELSR